MAELSVSAKLVVLLSPHFSTWHSVYRLCDHPHPTRILSGTFAWSTCAMASLCAARVAATPAVGAARVRQSTFGGGGRRATSCSSSSSEPSRSRSTPSVRPVPGSSGRDTHVTHGVAPYAKDSVIREVARQRGSGDAAKRERTAKHTFHTEHGRQVHVEVIPVGETYLAIFEVAEDVEHDLNGNPVTDNCGELSLHWGMHREWLDEWMTLPELPAGSVYLEKNEVGDPRGKSAGAATRTPLIRDGDRNTVVYRRGFPLRFARAKFEIPSYYAPLEMNFVLVEKKPDNDDGTPGDTIFDGPKKRSIYDPPKSFAVPVGAAPGSPEPLGASRAVELGPTTGPGWVNFALHSSRAAKVTLFVQYKHGDGDSPETMEFALNPSAHKTGDVWHIALPVGMRGAILPMPAPASAVQGGEGGVGGALSDGYSNHNNSPIAEVLYGWKCDGEVRLGGWRFHPGMVLFDPRATCLKPPLGVFEDAQTNVPHLMGSLADVMNSDDANAFAMFVNQTQRINNPRLRRTPGMEVAYELNVSDFTGHVSFVESLGVETLPTAIPKSFPGTYEAVLQKTEHILNTGATTVILQPVQASLQRGKDDNFGQNPITLFAPDAKLASPMRGEPTHQLRALIRGLQSKGLEVLMHIQITHLGEGSDEVPNSSSLRGVDAESYYQLGPTGRVEMNPAIDGAAVLNPCSAVTQRLMLDALKHWRVNMGIDGFIVDSGGGIARGPYGRSTLLEAIANDPVLGGGAGGHHGGGAGSGGGVRLYLTPGEFEVGLMQNWGVWGERVTPAYQRDVCMFLEGQSGAVGAFAARVCGSADLIKGERSAARGHVMNSFVSAPFGKTLADLAGYTAMRAGVTPENAQMHDRSKQANQYKGGALAGAGFGVGTRKPGASVDAQKKAPVKKLPPLPPTPAETSLMLRTMLATLFLSDGTPVVAAGDEYGHSLRGHDDAPWSWRHDANAFRWDAVGLGERGGEITRFLSACAAFRRRRYDLFAAGGANVSWSKLTGQRAPSWESLGAAPQLMCRRHAATAPGARTVATSAIGGEAKEETVTQDVVAIWNMGTKLARAEIGQPPIGYAWVRVLDTALAVPADCELAYINLAGPQGTYLVAPHAVVVLELAPAPEGLAPTAEQVQAAKAAAKRRAARIPDAARAAPTPGLTRAPEQPASAPQQQPASQPQEQPAQQPASQPVQKPAQTPAQQPDQAPQGQQPAPEEFRPPSDPKQPSRPNMPARPSMPSSPPTFRPPP